MSYSFRYVIACIVTSALLVVDVHGQELSLQLVQNRIVTSAYDELEAINEELSGEERYASLADVFSERDDAPGDHRTAII